MENNTTKTKQDTFTIPTAKELLDAGVHFGHISRRWNPKIKPFIYQKKAGSHIIDLFKTQDSLQKACERVFEVAKSGGKILFLGSKSQIKDLLETEAKRVGAMYITKRWLGGTFTNFSEIKRSRDKLKKLVSERDEGKHQKYTKKERLLIAREINKLRVYHEGTLLMDKYPELMFVVDIKREKTAVYEAKLVGVEVVALVDTNSDPNEVAYPIPSNDDAIKSVALLVKTVADAVEAGYKAYGESLKSATKSKEGKGK